MRRLLTISLLTVAQTLALAPGVALAQMGGPGGGMRPMGPGTQPGGPDKGKEEEGPAEAAPDVTGTEPAIQPLPAWPGQREKSLQFFQLNGYMRGRGLAFFNFNLGIPQGASGPSAPFFIPYSEFGQPNNASPNPALPASCATRGNNNCRSNGFTTFDMRMRLEPTINVSEQVRVKAQIDVFDNLVAGTTPEGYYLSGLGRSGDAPLTAFSRSQVSPETGRNSFEDSIRVKRAWAEVRTPIGELRFGRMPSHWGTGMLVNNGDCLDCDFGTNVDRVMFVTKLWNHFFALMYDWVATGPTTRLLLPNQSNGPVYNADGLDDVWQVSLALGRQDKPEELKEKVERGELVANYGAYVVFRRQDWDNITNPGQGTGGVLNTGSDYGRLSANLTPRDAWALIPDLWFRLNYKKFHIEAEVAMIGGRVNKVSDQVVGATNGYTIASFGGVLRADYKLLRDALHIGIQIGSASGDSQEDKTARVNYRQSTFVYPDASTISRFAFDPDYHVDLILFRRILGTVNNATYMKAWAQYDLTENFSGKVDVIYSLANKAVAYPGNDNQLGVEIDAAIMYRNEEEGFYLGIMYGVLFPLRALSIPGAIYGMQFDRGADPAQTFQGRMVVKF